MTVPESHRRTADALEDCLLPLLRSQCKRVILLPASRSLAFFRPSALLARRCARLVAAACSTAACFCCSSASPVDHKTEGLAMLGEGLEALLCRLGAFVIAGRPVALISMPSIITISSVNGDL